MFYLTAEEVLSNIKYREVLDNCQERTQANMEKVKEYIIKYGYTDIIIERHHKYIESLICNNFELAKLVPIFQMGIKTLESVFLRIESQYELYIADNQINPDTGNQEKDKKIKEILLKVKKDINLLPDYNKKIAQLLLQGKSIEQTMQELNKKNKKQMIESNIIGRTNPRYPSEKGFLKLIEEKKII